MYTQAKSAGATRTPERAKRDTPDPVIVCALKEYWFRNYPEVPTEELAAGYMDQINGAVNWHLHDDKTIAVIAQDVHKEYPPRDEAKDVVERQLTEDSDVDWRFAGFDR